MQRFAQPQPEDFQIRMRLTERGTFCLDIPHSTTTQARDQNLSIIHSKRITHSTIMVPLPVPLLPMINQ